MATRTRKTAQSTPAKVEDSAPVEVSPVVTAVTTDKADLTDYSPLAMIEAVASLPTDTEAGAYAATLAMGRVYGEVKSRHGKTIEAAMPVASRIVFAAHDAGVFTRDKGMGTAKFEAGKPMSMSAYARTLDQSHTYVARLLRLARAERAGIEPGTEEYSKVAQHGSASTFNVLDDPEAEVTPEVIREADAKRVKAIADKREESKREETKRELAESKRSEMDTLGHKDEALAHLRSVTELLTEDDLTADDVTLIRDALLAVADRAAGVLERKSA
jgi:hypothetical protein